jgi:hypothetical protein
MLVITCTCVRPHSRGRIFLRAPTGRCCPWWLATRWLAAGALRISPWGDQRGCRGRRGLVAWLKSFMGADKLVAAHGWHCARSGPVRLGPSSGCRALPTSVIAGVRGLRSCDDQRFGAAGTAWVGRPRARGVRCSHVRRHEPRQRPLGPGGRDDRPSGAHFAAAAACLRPFHCCGAGSSRPVPAST